MTTSDDANDRMLRRKLWFLVYSCFVVSVDDRDFYRLDRTTPELRTLENRALARLLPDFTEEERTEKLRAWEEASLWPIHPLELSDHVVLLRRPDELSRAHIKAKTAKNLQDVSDLLTFLDEEFYHHPDPVDEWWPY